jgi:hypothetical protein
MACGAITSEREAKLRPESRSWAGVTRGVQINWPSRKSRKMCRGNVMYQVKIT